MSIRNKRPSGLTFLICKAGAYLTGGYARFLLGIDETYNDIDIIVPPDKWYVISLLIPKNAQLNKHGGLKFKENNGVIVDIWPCSIEQHLRQCKSNMNKPEYILDYINNMVFVSQHI